MSTTFLLIAQSQIVQSGERGFLKEVLQSHASQLEKLGAAEISWQSRYLDATGNELSTAKYHTVLAQDKELLCDVRANERAICRIWKDGDYVEIIGYDPRAELANAIDIVHMDASLHDDNDSKSIHRLFSWRSLRYYKFVATDRGMTFEELCKSSSFEPQILEEGNLLRVTIGHPGVEPDLKNGALGIPRGTHVILDFDQRHGYHVKRHETTFSVPGNEQSLTLVMSVEEWNELPAGGFFPEKVRHALRSGDNVISEQLIQFDVPQNLDQQGQDWFRLPVNLLVGWYQGQELGEPAGFYVVTQDGELGPTYASEEIASIHQKHRLGILGDAAFAAHLKALGEIPVEGMTAPEIAATDINSQTVEKVESTDRFTVLKFWSTTCGPCQYSMSKFNKFSSEFSETHPNQVRCIAVALDDDVDVVRKHVESNGWKNLRHFVDQYVEDGRESSPAYPFKMAQKYGVTAIPLCVIVDRDGTIVYRGHAIDEGMEVVRNRMVSDRIP